MLEDDNNDALILSYVNHVNYRKKKKSFNLKPSLLYVN